MRLKNTLAVARQLGRSMAVNARDALLPGRALPLSDEQVARPDFLNQLFTEHGLGEYQHLPAVSHARLLDTQSISSNCNNRVIALDYSNNAGSGDQPATMFLKMPVRNLTTRLFFNVIRSWELECRFYRSLAQRLPVRTPQAYAVACGGSRFLMLLENLYPDPSIVLHTNPQMLQGPSLHTTRRCLRTLAGIHAEFHNIGRQEREQLLPAHLQPYTAPVMRAVAPLLGTLAMTRCQHQPQLVITAEQVQWYRRALKHWDLLIDWWSREPLTLVHGDSHLGNHFLHGDEAGMLDWQAVQWGKGIRDVQYFLTDSLPAETLAANEEALVRYYLSALAEHGVVLDYAETWHQYRGFSLQTWMTIIVSMGFGAMTPEMDAVMPEIHRRCIASIERLQLGDWLDGVLPPSAA